MHVFNDVLPDFPVNCPFDSSLNEYQVATVQHMLQMERGTVLRTKDVYELSVKKTKVGILTNRVGSGKTRCALALAFSPHKPFIITPDTYNLLKDVDPAVHALIGSSLSSSLRPGTNCIYEEKAFIKETFGAAREPQDNRTLIVVQNHLLPQWLRESEQIGITWTKQSLPTRRCTYYTCANVTLVTPSFLISREDYYTRLIYDECDSYHRHTHPERIKRDFTWILTATLYRVPQKYPFVRILNLHDVAIRASDPFIDAVATFPPVRHVTHQVSAPYLFTLQTRAPLIMTVTARQFLEQLCTTLEHDRANLVDRQNASRVVVKGLEEKIHQTDAKIQRIETQLSELAQRKNACPICLDLPPDKPVLTSCCDKVFCKYCILKCMTCCPFCRTRGFTLSTIEGCVSNMEHQPSLRKRDDVLFDIIQPDKKYLLIGDSGDIGRLRFVLEAHGVTNEYMAVKRRQVEDHREGKFQVLIFNSQFFGKGLNLTYCDELIIYSNLNSSAETQVCGRLCRLGRTREVVVHKFEEVHSE